MSKFNKRLMQVLLLGLVLLLIIVSLKELVLFLPGILGAITLYILSRANYFRLVYERKWKRGWTALLYILYYLILLGIPVFLAITLLSPKVEAVLSNPTEVVNNIKTSVEEMQQKTGVTFISKDALSKSLETAVAFIPTILNSTVNLLLNLVLILFFLYYLLYHGSAIERTLTKLIPLKPTNTTLLASETKRVIKANALGIPLISIIQGLTATLGYFIFGVDDFALWGFLTGVFAFFPIVGTMVVWVPLVIYIFTTGTTFNAIGLLIYSVAITGNIDYVARITIMKRMGDVHPVVTVLGVIIGLGLFGFIGLVFGPLLVSYIIVLSKIYMNEFASVSNESGAEKVTAKENTNEKPPLTV